MVRLDRFSGLEPARQDSVELVGDFQTQSIKLMAEIGRVVKVELVAFWGMPEDVAIGIHEVEVDDDQAVVAVHPRPKE